MQRLPLLLAAPMLVVLALTGCASGTATPSANAAKSASSRITAAESSAAAPSAAATAPSDGSSGGANAGTITFSGTVSGSMTVTDCQIGHAILEVKIDGASSTYSGLLDTVAFTFEDPKGDAYAIKKGQKIAVSNGGTTYTVANVTLVGLEQQGAVTASGSVNCDTEE